MITSLILSITAVMFQFTEHALLEKQDASCKFASASFGPSPFRLKSCKKGILPQRSLTTASQQLYSEDE